jgi:hypothetical protein
MSKSWKFVESASLGRVGCQLRQQLDALGLVAGGMEVALMLAYENQTVGCFISDEFFGFGVLLDGRDVGCPNGFGERQT